MNNKKVTGGSFPPSVGWVPTLIALAIVIVASTLMFVPQYGTHQLFGVSSGQAGSQSAQSNGGLPGSNDISGPGKSGSVPGAGTAKGPATSHTGGQTQTVDCSHGHNNGHTDTGVSATQINVASTIVTTGIGAGFLGEALQGMRAAMNQVNQAGGICGRHIALTTLNDGWDGPTGESDISGFINNGETFALVGEPDSEGLQAATTAQTIDRAGIPVVGTDGMLASQYRDPWIWPVAASTVTNMHLIAQFVAQHHYGKVGIVYDNVYKFGSEGATAFKAEVERLAGSSMQMGGSCDKGFCGISPSDTDYSTAVTAFNGFCQQSSGNAPCDLVVMLLEPKPMETWMKDEENCSCSWYKTLMGGEPLFDDNLANTCGEDCAGMQVWTGYKPDIQPFDSEQAVYTFVHALNAACPSCDPHNEFTEGAYLGAELFITACQRVGSNLTRAALRAELDSDTFDLGLSQPLHYGSGPTHLANVSMAAFGDNATGSFNGWSYLRTGFISDPSPGMDLQNQ